MKFCRIIAVIILELGLSLAVPMLWTTITYAHLI